MKWVFILLGVLLVGWLVVAQRNSTKTSYVNGLSEYNTLPGREYIFERDCYVFKLKEHNTSWPLVGDHALVAGLPDAIDPKQIGADLPDLRVLDIVRTGSRFKLVSVRRDENRKGDHVSFEILFLDEAERQYPRLDAFHIMDHSPEAQGAAPGILPAYAVERVKY
jgi:hypothetical protein